MKTQEISIVLADDHPMLLKGLYDELDNHGYRVIGQSSDGMQALELVLKLQPDVALLDIDMPLLTGFDVVRMAKGKGSATKFIVLSFHKELDYVSQAKALQIDGYLLKEDSFFDIQRCIESVMKGDQYFSRSFQSNILQSASEELKKIKSLTPSEITILKMIANQLPTNHIADELNVSKRTIEKHRSNIILKLNLDGGTNSLTNWALSNKSLIQEI